MPRQRTKTLTVNIPLVRKDILEKNFSSIPNCCGAYVIKVQSGKRYVGSSKTLRSRIMQHRDKLDPNISRADKMVSTCIYQTHSHQEARLIEHWLIREIAPVLNRTPTTTTSCDLRCNQDCESWEAPARPVTLTVNVLDRRDDIPGSRLSSLPKKPGVYEITTTSGKRYVGSSSNICSRVKEHSTLKGKNVQEAIASVCCSVTTDRVDAYILEYATIHEQKPDLNREFRDDAWKWKTQDLAKHFEKRPELEPLFEALSDEIHAQLPELKPVVRSDRVTYGSGPLKNVFFVRFMKGRLRIDLKDPESKIKDSSDFSWPIEPKQTDVFHRRLELRHADDISKTLDIIRQAWAHMS